MSRETQEQQRKYLSELAARFQNIALLAIKARYGGDDAFDQHPMLKLATMVINRNDIFARDFARRGHAVQFGVHTSAGDSEDGEDDESEAASDPEDNNDGSEVVEAVEAVSAPLHSAFAQILCALVRKVQPDALRFTDVPIS